MAKGEAEVRLENDKLSILPKSGEAIVISLIDIVEIVPSDYRLLLTLSSGERITLFDLGYKFGDVVSNLYHLRNEIILKYLLINESIKRSEIWGDLILIDAAEVKKEYERCEIRLYETSIVFLPPAGDPIRVHYSDIKELEAKDYAISIRTERGEQFTILRLGKEFDSTSRDLSNSINALNIRTQSLIKELAPSADLSTIMAVSRIMKDGKAASIRQLTSISPIVLDQFEKSVGQTSISKEYQYLQSLAWRDKIAIGLKRGLMGDLTGTYVWLLVPIFQNEHGYGNAVALETTRLMPTANHTTEKSNADGVGAPTDPTTETGGNATYFFRMVGRKDYSTLSTNTKELETTIDRMSQRIDELMLDINFRREPIFLSDETLATEPKYARYRYAVEKIPSLKELRRLFIGRVIHSSFDQWKSNVEELLQFNGAAKGDERWNQ